MPSGTRIRPLTRLLDASGRPVWAIDPQGRLVYLSAACADWLGVDIESLVNRRSIAGASVSADPLDQIAALLSPPPGLRQRGSASLRIQPPGTTSHRPAALEVRFLRVGEGDRSLTIGVGGVFEDRSADAELQDAVAIRQRLDAWRKQQGQLAAIATAGVSAAARRMRRRLQVAASTRTDMGFFGPPGCDNESIAARIHELSATDEPLVIVDGPLMDAELLDATLMPLVHQLTESATACGTAMIRGLDEMPQEAQQRLCDLLTTFSGRLRLLALCGPRPRLLAESLEAQPDDPDSLELDEGASRGVAGELIEIISALTFDHPPLRSRVDDIPLLATALLDAEHAAGKGTAERLSRAALDKLVIYPWPRNLLELQEAIGYAMRRVTGESVGVEHLPLAIRSFRPGESPAPAKSLAVSLDDAVARFELRLIEETLENTSGNRAEAARRLGISRARLLRKLEERSRVDANRDDDQSDD